MSVSGVVRRLQRYSASEVARKLPSYVRRRWRAELRRRRVRRGTYAPAVPAAPVARLLPDLSAEVAPADRPVLAGLASQYLAQRIDVLGSGWQTLHHGEPAPGLEGHRYEGGPPVTADPGGRWLAERVSPANLEAAQAAWRLVSDGYTPIDWQRDVKSGYRWDERTLDQDVPIAHRPGVDVKVPWEIGRLHHLPVLALAYQVARRDAEGFADPAVYLQAFRDQVLDFVATNPPCYGVQWFTAMLSGIRGANLAVAYDLFRAAGASFDAAFTATLRRSLLEHGRHVLDRLEWWDLGHRNNHYLANISGLVAVAAYLPATPETDAWLAFGHRELVRETLHQFQPDGSNFELSTCYHAFSAEMVAWGLGFLEAVPEARWRHLPDADLRHLPTHVARRVVSRNGTRIPTAGPRIPADVYDRLARARMLLRHVTKPDGRLVQLGDNDSGRFIKLMPPATPHTPEQATARYASLAGYAAPDAFLEGEPAYWDEDMLDYRTTIGALDGLLGVAGKGPEYAALRALHGDSSHTPAAPEPRRPAADEGAWADWLQRVEALPAERRSEVVWRVEEDGLRDGMDLVAYPDMGLYVYRSKRVFACLRCGPAETPEQQGHVHADQLGLDLVIDGEVLAMDPGTYVYTPLLARRNQYRAAAAHFAPHRAAAEEAGDLDDAFAGFAWQPATCEVAGLKGFVGRRPTPTGPAYRLLHFADDAVRLVDFVLDDGVPPHDLPAAWARHRAFPTSVGYGKVARPEASAPSVSASDPA